MSKRRRPVRVDAPLEPTNLRRLPAVGDELSRLVEAAIVAYTTAGSRGLTRLELARAIDTGRNGARATIESLRGRERIFVVTWRRGHPAYALGNLADAPRPIPPEKDAARRKTRDVMAMAKQDIADSHAKWAATWTPHRDMAAAWIGGTV